MRYILEVNEPGEVETVAEVYESKSPFMPIHVGDLINPFPWADHYSPMKILRAIAIEHILSETMHKVVVHTEILDTTDALGFYDDV